MHQEERKVIPEIEYRCGGPIWPFLRVVVAVVAAGNATSAIPISSEYQLTLHRAEDSARSPANELGYAYL